MLGKQANVAKLLNKLSVTELAELSNLSKAYISQVKHGNRPPSQKLIDALTRKVNTKRVDYLSPFLLPHQSTNVNPNTIELYRFVMECFLFQIEPHKARSQDIERYLLSIPPKGIRGLLAFKDSLKFYKAPLS